MGVQPIALALFILDTVLVDTSGRQSYYQRCLPEVPTKGSVLVTLKLSVANHKLLLLFYCFAFFWNPPLEPILCTRGGFQRGVPEPVSENMPTAVLIYSCLTRMYRLSIKSTGSEAKLRLLRSCLWSLWVTMC